MKLKKHRLGLVMGLLLATPLATSISYAQDDAGMPPAPPAGEAGGPPPGPPGGPAADDGARPPRGPRGEGGPRGGDRAERILTEEERTKLSAAREKVKDDAEVLAAQEAAKKANSDLAAIMEKKLLEADSTLQPILEKLKESRERMANRRGGPGGPGAEGKRPGKPGEGKDPGADAGKPGKKDGLTKLSPEEREALKVARAAAKDDPSVTAARDKVQTATSPEEKGAARKELQTALRDAMTKANPETASILEKVAAEQKPNAVN